jgi:tetratricopeptide (TPR) repeat protein
MCAVTRLISLALLLLAPAPLYAQRDRDTYSANNQTFEVTGQVNLAGTNSTARDFPVRLERFSGGVIDQINTDARGRFRFANLQRGYYRVIINAPGFAPAQQEADLTLLAKAYLVFTLVHSEKNGNGASPGEVIDARVPQNARDEFTRGREALARRNPSEAITHFHKATSFYAEFFEAQLMLGTAFLDLRDWPKAESSLIRALEIKPDNPPARLALGEVYWRQKLFDEAERTLLEGLKLDEKNWHGHFTLARLYWEKGDALKAGPCVGRTLQLKPDFAEAHLLAGNILLKVGQPQRAEVEYEEYLRLSPKGEYAAEARTLIEKLHKLANGKPE